MLSAYPGCHDHSNPDSSGSMGVDFWELDLSSMGQDLVALLTDEEAACGENELGGDYQAMLKAPLVGEPGTMLWDGASDALPLSQCYTVGRGAPVSLLLSSAAAGRLSAGEAVWAEVVVSSAGKQRC